MTGEQKHFEIYYKGEKIASCKSRPLWKCKSVNFLKEDLEQAPEEEDYEFASMLRDEIKSRE